ncbi:MAG TPA: electron transport complex subunit RsxB [Woeseiaceae bacterium]|nr:electron transport complex subunit RsxB [Woeseiaceae bacterium]
MDTILTAVVTIAALAAAAGLLLAVASRRLPPAASDLEDRIDALLPQTQCAQCGYPGCRPYARAIATEGAPINLCPPGGDETVARLAGLLGREKLPLPIPAPAGRVVAVIDESACIGCMHCRRACPVDAIVGAQHRMHTVITDECTGCELCIAPCPVDCITLVPAKAAPLGQVA